MAWIDKTEGLSEVVNVQNVRPVLRLLEIRDLNDQEEMVPGKTRSLRTFVDVSTERAVKLPVDEAEQVRDFLPAERLENVQTFWGTPPRLRRVRGRKLRSCESDWLT